MSLHRPTLHYDLLAAVLTYSLLLYTAQQKR